MSFADLLAAELRRDGARPFLTWYDDASGERIELSVATLANWAAKTANLLSDEHGLMPSDPVRIRPPDHWQSMVAVAGAWTLGAAVDLLGGRATLDVPGDVSAFAGAVLPQPDVSTVPPADADDLALVAHGRTWSVAQLAAAARAAVVHHDVPRGARVLSTLPLDTVDGLDATLLVPLAAGGSVVWVVNLDPARQADRAATERVTMTAGTDIPGLPRLDPG